MCGGKQNMKLKFGKYTDITNFAKKVEEEWQ